MSDYLGYRDSELVRLEVGDKMVEGTRPWRRVVERVRMGRLAWARKLTRLTGMRIAGSSDGHWARWVNRELLDRLAGKFGLDDAGKAVLIRGDQLGSMTVEDVHRAGVLAAGEVEAEYRAVLSRVGIRGWLREHDKDYAASGRVKAERTARTHARDEFLLFWPWVKDLRDLVGGRRSPTETDESLPGLTVDVVSLVGDEPGATVKVPVLKARELMDVPPRVVEVFDRVAGYLALVGKPKVTEAQLAPARAFFEGMGLRLAKDSLTGYLAKDWSRVLASELFEEGTETLHPEDYSRACSILVAGVRRMFEASGLSVNPDCRESDNGLVRTTGLVEKAAHFGRGRLILREIARSGLVPKEHVIPRMDAMWTKRKTGTVYRSVVRSRLPVAVREFWEAKGSTQSRSFVMTETLGDVRLASLLDGAAAGHLRRFMETQASAGLKAAVDPSAPGALAPAAFAPVEVWKELRRAIFDARVWAAHELFYGGEWMGLSPDYRRRLRLALDHFLSFVAADHDVSDVGRYAFVQIEEFLGVEPHTHLGAGFPHNFRHKIGSVHHVLALLSEGVDLVPGDFPLTYWTEQRAALKHLPVMRTVARLLCAGRNRVSRALGVALNLRAVCGTLPDILKPVVPVDGPEPLAYLASLEVSRGMGLSRLFEIVGADKPGTAALASQLLKMKPQDFDLSFFDPRADEMAKYVPMGALRAQWEWARRQPCLIGFGGGFWFQELTLLRLGLARVYPKSVIL